MIRHVVMWELHDQADAARFKAELMSCAALSPGTLSFMVGTRTDGLAASCDVCLVADFEDAAAMQAYQDHPHHHEVSARLGPLRRLRHVLDFEA
jgi:quinol monooxygenase YgiN